MKLWDRYCIPRTVGEATDLLKQYDGSARIVAGGTDLLLEIKLGHFPPAHTLIDITRISELAQVTQQDEMVTIGAGVTHTQIVETELLAARATCLVESCGVVGGPQVRNVATLAGNVAHGLPAADGTISLVALDAEVEIWQNGDRRWVHILEMFKGPGESLVDPTRDMLVNFRFKLCGEREATAFKRIMRPQGVALPILGCAAWVKLYQESQIIEEIRICIGPSGPVPTRATEVEEVLRGKAYDKQLLSEAVRVAREKIHPRTSKYRATADYRIEMVEVLLRRVLPLAIQRAHSGQAAPEGIGLK